MPEQIPGDYDFWKGDNGPYENDGEPDCDRRCDGCPERGCPNRECEWEGDLADEAYERKEEPDG